MIEELCDGESMVVCNGVCLGDCTGCDTWLDGEIVANVKPQLMK